MSTLIILAFACLIVRLTRLSDARINALHLKPLAIITLIAAAIAPTQDPLTDLMLVAPLFLAYLGYVFIRGHIRGTGQHSAR